MTAGLRSGAGPALAALALVSGIGLVAATGCGGGTTVAHAHAPARRTPRRPEHVAAPPASAMVTARSVRGHRIEALEVGAARRARADLLVVGVIHGNEPAGEAVVRMLRRDLAAKPLDAWLIEDLNPDGVAASTRVNADRVDLNRNFPWRWTHLDAPGGLQYSGPRPLSEPEARFAERLVLRTRPRVAIWFHQPLGLVDESGGSVAVERRFSRLSGLPLRRLTRYPGSAVGWEDHVVPASTAFVVELPPGPLSGAAAARLARAVEALVGV